MKQVIGNNWKFDTCGKERVTCQPRPAFELQCLIANDSRIIVKEPSSILSSNV